MFSCLRGPRSYPPDLYEDHLKHNIRKGGQSGTWEIITQIVFFFFCQNHTRLERPLKLAQTTLTIKSKASLDGHRGKEKSHITIQKIASFTSYTMKSSWI